jgi:hypothetical protein
MRELQLSLLRFKNTKLCFGFLDRVDTFAWAKVSCSVTLRRPQTALYKKEKIRRGGFLHH